MVTLVADKLKRQIQIDSASLKSIPAHLSVECKIAESRVLGKPTIIVREKMFETIATSRLLTSPTHDRDHAMDWSNTNPS